MCYIPEKEITEDLERIIVAHLKKLLHEKHLLKCLWRTSNPVFTTLLKSLNAIPSNSGCWFRMDPKKVNEHKLLDWITAVDPGKMGLNLSYTGFIPNNMLDEVALVSNEMMNDMQREDNSLAFHVDADYLRHAQFNTAKMKQQPHHLFLRDKAGKIIGISMILTDHTGTLADQRMTGIVKEWRGMGLAKWLKAKMLLKIRTDMPAITNIRTECFSTNFPMISINAALGFELYRTDNDFFVSPSILESFLHS